VLTESRSADGRAAQVRVVRDLEGLEGLAETWARLDRWSTSPTQGFSWTHAGAVTFPRAHHLAVLTSGEPLEMAVAPLIEVGGRLEFLGAEELDEPIDVLSGDPDALAALAEGLWWSGRPVFLKRVPANSPLIPALERAYQGRGFVIRRPQAAYPWIPIDKSWVEPERHFNAGRRSDFRRARRIAERWGPVSVQIGLPSPDQVSPLLDEAIRVEAAGWKGRRGSALACDPIRHAFFRRFAAAACREGVLHLGLLRIGDRAAAMQLGVECAGRLWLLKIGYDEVFSRCSPGTLLMLEMLRAAAEGGVGSVEFLGEVEPWTRLWAQQERPCVSLRAYPASGVAACVFVADLAKMGWRWFARARWPGNGDETGLRADGSGAGASP